jgi:type IV pilus assembly protein PilO
MAIGANMTKSEQIMVTVAAVAIIGAAAFWYFLYQPQKAKLDALATHVDSLETRNRQAHVDLARGTAEQFAAEAATYEKNLQVMRLLVPTTNEVPALVEDISTSARRVGLDLARVEPGAVIPGEQFDTYRYQIGVIGGYHEIGQFLSNIGSLSRIMASDGLELKVRGAQPSTAIGHKKPAPETRVEATFQVQTYVARTTPLVLSKGGK